MKFLEIFLSVIGIVAIVAAAAFILIFLVDLFVSISDKNDGIFFKRSKRNNADNIKVKTANNNAPAININRVPYYAEDKEAELEVVPSEIESNIDYEAAAKEQEELEKLNAKQDDVDAILNENIEETTEVAETDQEMPAEELIPEVVDNVDESADTIDELDLIADSVKEDEVAKILAQYEDVINLEEDKNLEVDALSDLEDMQYGLESIKDEKVKDMVATEDEADEIEKLIKDLQEKEEKEEFTEILDTVKTENVEIKKELNKTNKEIDKVVEEKEEAEKIIAQKEKEIQALKEELLRAKQDNKPAQPIVIVGGATVEELEVRLESLEERKKANDKELKKVRREFIPLNTVRKTLDSDKKKLRRKEAIVAKQNVLLYGVNNYVDIDDEKAKKLTEEHELLEGLRMSVKHCEEVLENNKERLPVLEQAYNILVSNKETIDKDITEVETAIAQLKTK